MIRISQIDSEFSIYKNNTVVLLKKGSIDQELFELLKYNKIKPEYICDVNKENWGEIIKNIPVISPEHLEYMSKKSIQKSGGGQIIVQVASKKVGLEIIDKISSFGIDKIITFNEAYQIFNFINKLKLLNQYPHLVSVYETLKKDARIINKRPEVLNYIFKNSNLKEYNFIVSVEKTGDITLKSTLSKNNIPILFTLHTPESLDKQFIYDFNKKIKVITGIRDPISRDLSHLYQSISILSSAHYAYNLYENHSTFLQDGGDSQKMFDLWFNNIENTNYNCIMSNFMNRFSENIIDISKYPFDQEKGYTIIKEGNLEVFVYQLEKLNSLPKIMSDWLGQTPFDQWSIANVADDKWIANSYKQAQKEITFSQEYFDRCYNDKWIQHFYSQEDIEKFKERWRPHIR